MGYSISIDNWQQEKWNQIGMDTMRSYFESDEAGQKYIKKEYGNNDERSNDEACERYFPMMNYAYPLYSTPSESEIINVCLNTSCTVVEDNETGDYFLALRGGGQDLSQDIGLAYILAGERIPLDLIFSISTQKAMTINAKEFKLLRRNIISELKAMRKSCLHTQKIWQSIK